MQTLPVTEAPAATPIKPMGQIAFGGQVFSPQLPALELPTEDGIPMESPWHSANMMLLIDSIRTVWRDRTDYYCGGNMFIYFSLDQAHQVIEELGRGELPPPSRRAFRGPDFFVVLDVDGARPRDAWIVWEEQGRYPNVIVELQSPSTASYDEGRKKTLYEQTFRTPDYFCVDPVAMELKGWHLANKHYATLTANDQGRLWCNELGMWLGWWEGIYQGKSGTWARLFDRDGDLVLTFGEAEAQRAEAEAQRAEAEAQRARTAEAENFRLRALLHKAGIDHNYATTQAGEE